MNLHSQHMISFIIKYLLVGIFLLGIVNCHNQVAQQGWLQQEAIDRPWIIDQQKASKIWVPRVK